MSGCPPRGDWCGSVWRPITPRSRPFRGCSRRSPIAPDFASSATSRSAATCRATSFAAHYHAVVWSVGAQLDRPLGIPGEDLPGSLSATAFVAWYNGHPDYARPRGRPRRRPRRGGRQRQRGGRLRAHAGADARGARAHRHHRRRDRGDRDLAASRRSWCSAAAGRCRPRSRQPELLELGELAGADVLVDPADWLDVAVAGGGASTTQRGTSRSCASTPSGRATGQAAGRAAPLPASRRWSCAAHGRVEEIVIGSNRLEPGPTGRCGRCRPARPRCIACGLVLRSVGYRGTPLEGVPFDEGARGHPQRRWARGRRRGRPVGEYCAGWIKRGPSGIIGTNKKDANEPSGLLLEDAAAGLLPAPADRRPAAIEALVAERAAATPSSTPAGRRSTPTSATAASRTAARG